MLWCHGSCKARRLDFGGDLAFSGMSGIADVNFLCDQYMSVVMSWWRTGRECVDIPSTNIQRVMGRFTMKLRLVFDSWNSIFTSRYST